DDSCGRGRVGSARRARQRRRSWRRRDPSHQADQGPAQLVRRLRQEERPRPLVAAQRARRGRGFPRLRRRQLRDRLAALRRRRLDCGRRKVHPAALSELPAATLDLARRAAAAVDPERVVELASGLVRIRSVYDERRGTTEAGAAKYVADQLRRAGFEPVVEDAAPNRPNVICDFTGSAFDEARDRTLMREGHTDVVTEGDPTVWTIPPFEGRIDPGPDGEAVTGVLHGRGSADMKAGVAAAMAAVEAVRHVAPELPGRIRLGILADDEGLMLGIKSYIDNGWADDMEGGI